MSGTVDRRESGTVEQVSDAVDEWMVMERVGKTAHEGEDERVCGTVMDGVAMMHQIGRKVERVHIRWGSNDSKKYDGKVKDVPVQWVIDAEMLVMSQRMLGEEGPGVVW